VGPVLHNHFTAILQQIVNVSLALTVSTFTMKAVSIHTKAYRESGRTAPLILNLGSAPPFAPGKNPSTHRTGGWVHPRFDPDILKMRKSLGPVRIQTPEWPTCSLVTAPTTLSQFKAHFKYFAL
jgi:hypothetical protein